MPDTSELTSDKQAPHKPHSPRDLLTTFDVFSKFAVSLAGVIVAISIGWASLYHNRKAIERQIQAQSEALSAQRRIAGAQLVMSILSRPPGASETERQISLEVLASISPEQAQLLGALMKERSEKPHEKQIANDIIRLSNRERQELEFTQHLEDARKYLDFGLEAQAAREFSRAYDNLPDHLRAFVSRAAIRDARSDFEKGEFSAAVRRFKEEFGRLPARPDRLPGDAGQPVH